MTTDNEIMKKEDITMNIIEKAIQFAAKAHEETVRKGTSLPYILHPVEAGAIAAQLTDDPEVIAAAVLHDVVEDTSFSEADIRVLFGNRVADLVMFDTEDKLRDRPAAETWMTRKQETIRRLQHATDNEMIVVFADKLSNLRSLLIDYKREEESLWDRFTQKDSSKHVWYYLSLLDVFEMLFEKRKDNTLLWEYARYVKELRMLVQEYQDFGSHNPKAITIISSPEEKIYVLQQKGTDEVFTMTPEEFHAFLSEISGQKTT